MPTATERNRAAWKAKYAPLMGREVKIKFETFRMVSSSEHGQPTFARLQSDGTPSTSLYWLGPDGYGKEWAEAELAKLGAK